MVAKTRDVRVLCEFQVSLEWVLAWVWGGRAAGFRLNSLSNHVEATSSSHSCQNSLQTRIFVGAGRCGQEG